MKRKEPPAESTIISCVKWRHYSFEACPFQNGDRHRILKHPTNNSNRVLVKFIGSSAAAAAAVSASVCCCHCCCSCRLLCLFFAFKCFCIFPFSFPSFSIWGRGPGEGVDRKSGEVEPLVSFDSTLGAFAARKATKKKLLPTKEK